MADPVTELTPSANTATPLTRNVRRRLVQSTLFPHKPAEPRNKPEENGDSCDEQDEDYCETKSRRKRKSKGKKVTPTTNKGSKSATPKKNAPASGIMGSISRNVLSDFDKVDKPKPDLRLEAKLSAEENSRMFAGRQVHPFFSSCKAGKKVQELSESGSDLFKAKSGDERITCGPIHVFENIKDDTSSLDWRNWTFLRNSTHVNGGLESSNSSVYEGSVECLNFDKLLSTLHPLGASSFHSPCPENLQETSLSNSTLQEEQTKIAQMPNNAKVDLEVDESDTFSVLAGYFRKSCTEPSSRFLQESLRSYYVGCEDKPEGSLWAYKYKPTKAVEVCGNDKAVNFLSDWLHQWHERRYNPRTETSKRDTRVVQDDYDYICSDSDYDSEDINEEDSLQNVLLITGPTGSGKSAAVYACAKEQGFDILELNASDCRNGTVVKQYFGDALGSHGFKRLSEHTSSSQKITTNFPPACALINDKAADEVNDRVVELITLSDDEARSTCKTSQKLLGKNDVVACDKVQTLILVEDVDILFPEDRGCIAAIQQIAETARGPIILTSNSDNPGLPDNFDRLHVSFSLPTPKELLCHLYSVCLGEGAPIHPLLLEKFIQSCDGDIRKTIMHLQFWLQSKIFSKDLKAQTGYPSLPFDLEGGHHILPKIMPWDFPSEISELIENEFVKSVNIMEENCSMQGLVEEELQINESQNDSDEQYMETDYIKAKKVEMIKRNGSVTDYGELEIQYNAISEFPNSSKSPEASYLLSGRKKLVVMSSDSEEEDSNNRYPQDTEDEANKRHSIKGNNECTSEIQLNENCPSTSFRKLVCSELEDSDEECDKYSKAADVKCINQTSKSFDISCVPESSIVPETAIESETDTTSGAVSSRHCQEVSMNNELKPFTLCARRRLTKLSHNSDMLTDAEIPDSSKEALQDFLDENMETTINKVMDECSRVDFKLKSTFVESSPLLETDIVQNLWKKLRQMDLRQHTISEQLGASEVVKLASGLSNLISEADMFHNYQHKHDILEPQSFDSNEATTSCYNDETMMYTVASHGFCFYVKLIADVGSKLGCANMIDLTSEMLASTTNTMTLGKLSRQDLAKSTVIYTGKELELNNPISNVKKSENKASLFEVVQSIVPERISLAALKGDIFYEYLSSLRQISRSEAVCASQCVEKKRRGRSRGFQHYLSSCTMLSPEAITLVSDGDLYKKISQHTTNAESTPL